MPSACNKAVRGAQAFVFRVLITNSSFQGKQMSSDRSILQSGASHCLLAAATWSVLLLTGCGAGTRSVIAATNTATSPTPTTPTSPATSPPATLTSITPFAVMAGTQGASVALVGTNIVSGAIVLVDGVARAANYVSNTEIDVPLTAADLATPERHAFAVQNPQANASGAETLLVSSGYNAFGDSITKGVNLDSPVTQNYTALLSSSLSIAHTDNGIGGDQACDVFPRQIYPSGTGFASQPAALQSMMVGTNDVDYRGPGYFEPVYNACYRAALAWLGTPRESRVMAGDSSLSTTGACANTPSVTNFGGVACSAAGTITGRLSTTGNPIYIWYTYSESATAASFQVSLDGVASGTYYMLTPGSISTNNGTRSSVALIRLPTAAGPHTVTITTATGNIGIQGLGSNPSSGTTLPRVLAGDLPNQELTDPWAPIASQLIYNADIAANVALIASDGIDLRLASTRNFMLGSAAEMTDSLHPNALGHQHLEAAFLSALP